MTHLTQHQAAELAGITDRRLRQLEADTENPDPPPREAAGYPLRAFGTWLRRRALAEVVQTPEGESLSLDAQRARLARAQADLTELRAAEFARELVRVADVETEWGRMLGALRSRLLSLPTRVAPDVAVESDPAVCATIVQDVVIEALGELSGSGVPHPHEAAEAAEAEQ
jgi:phage terminase Nu1 subunit (DNA packaging protein)